jgi:hypothetical protein
MDNDSISIVCQYCDNITSLIGLDQWHASIQGKPVLFSDAKGKKRKVASEDPTPAKRQKLASGFVPAMNELDILCITNRLQQKYLSQFSASIRPYLEKHYELDHEWWDSVKQFKGLLSGSFLLHFLHGEPERAADVDFFFQQPLVRAANEDFFFQPFDDPSDIASGKGPFSWLTRHGYTMKYHVESYAHTYESYQYVKMVHGKQHAVNIVFTGPRSPSESIDLFDFDFLKNTYDGATLTVADMQSVWTKTSLYTPSPDDAALPSRKSDATRFARCVKYIDRGYIIPNFQLPTKVDHEIHILQRSIVSRTNTIHYHRKMEWILAYNQKPENAHRRIPIQVVLYSLSGHETATPDDLVRMTLGQSIHMFNVCTMF